MVIIRLCTDEAKVVNYWNNIDSQLEIQIDVIDDPLGEAKQINAINGWLVYAEPIHRIREFGASMVEFDILDEATISGDQLRLFIAYL